MLGSDAKILHFQSRLLRNSVDGKVYRMMGAVQLSPTNLIARVSPSARNK